MSKKVDLKKSGERENKDSSARSEENGEIVNGCYYAPWDF